MNLQKITLIYFGYFDDDFLQHLKTKIYNEFFVNIQIKEAHLDLSDFYNPMRRQYDANELLYYIENHFSDDVSKTIGLFNVDLFIPIFTYIFGQAFLNGRSGIASYYRLSNERYGMDADINILTERFAKELIHELGHTYGLVHCHTTDCVMRSVTYVEDIDQKNLGFCPFCKSQLMQ
jgi:archaemetzincin